MCKKKHQQDFYIRKQKSVMSSFNTFVRKGGLKEVLGEKTPYYKHLFIDGYKPGTFTLQDRIVNPDFLSEHERDFNHWLKGVIERELSDLRSTSDINLPPTNEILGNITECICQILKYRLDNGTPISNLIFNQEYPDVLHRILLWILVGEPQREFYVYEKFNELGRELAYTILREISPNEPLIRLCKLAIVSGALGLEIKGQDAATSPFSNRGIKLALEKDADWQNNVDRIQETLLELSSRNFSIDFWPEFQQEVVETSTMTRLGWFTDDYIESIFDLKLIQSLLKKNANLRVDLIPRAGRYGNDASYQDVMQFLALPLFKELKGLCRRERLTVTDRGPKAGTINGKKISQEVASIIEKSKALVVRGARSYETLQGILKPTYFSFVVCREFSETVTGLCSDDFPLVFIRQENGVVSFKNFKFRAKRTWKLPTGRIVKLAQKTAIESESILRHISAKITD